MVFVSGVVALKKPLAGLWSLAFAVFVAQGHTADPDGGDTEDDADGVEADEVKDWDDNDHGDDENSDGFPEGFECAHGSVPLVGAWGYPSWFRIQHQGSLLSYSLVPSNM